jgi:RNA-binding protein
METLTPAQRRALRAKAHHLHPVVTIGQHGLTEAVLREIDVNLKAHELIKIRVFEDVRAAREALMSEICAALGAASVQHLGKLLIVWRPAPVENDAPARVPKAVAKSAANKAPQARRPRSPLPRTPSRPPRGRPPLEAPATSRRRRRGADATRVAAPTAKRGTPHGKSLSSLKGASGARRRRKAQNR